MRRTNAFSILKEHSQSTLDFSVLATTAIPQLRYSFDQFDIDPSTHLVENTSFRNSNEPYSTEKRAMARYKTVLGANILLSNFSFFESYFFALIDEIIEFHGGKEEYIEFIKKKVTEPSLLNEQELKDLTKLRKKYDKKKIDRYKKFTALVETKNLIWPSQKLALYGVNQIINNRKRWKSADIPSLVTNLLTLDLDSDTVNKYHNIRDDRNKMAHGKRLSYTLEKALEANKFLYDLAKKIDGHVISNFMIIEKHRK